MTDTSLGIGNIIVNKIFRLLALTVSLLVGKQAINISIRKK